MLPCLYAGSPAWYRNILLVHDCVHIFVTELLPFSLDLIFFHYFHDGNNFAEQRALPAFAATVGWESAESAGPPSEPDPGSWSFDWLLWTCEQQQKNHNVFLPAAGHLVWIPETPCLLRRLERHVFLLWATLRAIIQQYARCPPGLLTSCRARAYTERCLSPSQNSSMRRHMSLASAARRTKRPLTVDKLTDRAVKPFSLRETTHIWCYYRAVSNGGFKVQAGDGVGASQCWRPWSRCREAQGGSPLLPPPGKGHLSRLQPLKTCSWPRVLVGRKENQFFTDSKAGCAFHELFSSSHW